MDGGVTQSNKVILERVSEPLPPKKKSKPFHPPPDIFDMYYAVMGMLKCTLGLCDSKNIPIAYVVCHTLKEDKDVQEDGMDL